MPRSQARLAPSLLPISRGLLSRSVPLPTSTLSSGTGLASDSIRRQGCTGSTPAVCGVVL